MKWKAIFEKTTLLPFPNGVWRVKQINGAETPVCILPEPYGGNKNSSGRNAYMENNARLIETAPELLSELKKCVQALKDVKVLNGSKPIIEQAERIIKKADNV